MVSVPFPQTKGDGPVQPGDTSTRCAPHGKAAPSGGAAGTPRATPGPGFCCLCTPSNPHHEPRVTGQGGDTGLAVPVPSAPVTRHGLAPS